MVLPDLTFKTTSGDSVAIGLIGGLLVIYIYPMTGRPDVPQPDGWEQIPGARGFTAQSCSFRDHHQELQALKTEVYGLSSQTSAYQLEAKERLHLPFNLLSDSAFELKNSLSLPTFEAEGMELYKRLTLIAKDGKIEKVFYPVFPPDQNANDVLSWLQDNT
ncbi:peroxiredoxin [Chloroflexi bacterium TSY]|nr:peroxiredoxin [Chloroflexi bacterium TSY]